MKVAFFADVGVVAHVGKDTNNEGFRGGGRDGKNPSINRPV